MNKILAIFSILLLFFQQQTNAQYSRYIIRLKDKGTNPYTLANPVQYLSQKAVDRRTKYNVAIDSTDLPVTPRYIDSIRLAGNVTILNTSKWLNQVAIRTTDAAALAKINSFPFVIAASPVGSFAGETIVPVNKKLDADLTQGNPPPSPGPEDFVESIINYGKSNGQVKIHQGSFLHDHGFKGEGMQMAVLDAGFFHYLSLPTFDSVRLNNQILGTWDFVNNEASVDEDYDHGMKCLSTIAANIPGVLVGTAPKTSFYLYRTEDVFSEYPIEEQNWVAGMERADSLGVPVSSTSLGYNRFDNPALDYTYADMNGNTSISARGADMAARKGMLVVIAAGNTGNDPTWNQLITPSDADSVLSVGAVDTTGIVGSFSAYGPSSDGQVKPSVAAVGSPAYVANSFTGLPELGFGTSYACPNMAGLVTCLWQAFPEVNNMAVIDATQRSATRATTPDNRMGYGIPDMKKAFVLLIKKLYTQNISLNSCKTGVSFSVKTGADMMVEIERRSVNENTYSSIKTFNGEGAFAKRDYDFTDDLSFSAYGGVKYRIKMTIGTDTTFYLDSMTVNYIQSCLPSANNISMGPNPVANDLFINIERTTAAKMDIVVTNALGQKVFTKTFQQPAGYNVQAVPMAGMSRGIYFVTVFVDGKREVVKQVMR
ncbi:S8 family peptidase [Ferruginibacter sp. HRS2-29]|uniref:S8 family peptidase n=1 Tax=Ferruginibacter sp. HRS2-29 TaxID=2487334 RepID=UPI0020CFE06C|nr:S8 family peptidase [Ferruginibacter sp. HRS2-29]MCP9750663.1 T9SS C-terminal target domain-containing protein [Ferruginibacter sp. HRS2-29]